MGLGRLAFGIAAVCAAMPGQVGVLDRLAGTDLWKQRPSTADADLLDRMLGVRARDYNVPRPWHVWKTNAAGETRYIVLLGAGLLGTPGMSTAEVQLFDSRGKSLAHWPFQAGYRIDLTRARFEYSENLKSDMLELSTLPVIGGRDIATEYFAVGGGRFRLVRLENSKGESVINDYLFENNEIGVEPDAKDVGHFIALLESKDNADVLSALVFLGGRHEDTGLFHELIGSGRINELILRLGNSEDPWIRDAAAMAARGPRDRPIQ